MKTKEIPAETYVVLCVCHACEDGDLRRTEGIRIGLGGGGDRFLHKCTVCEHEEYLTEIYPQTRMRWEGE